ncbi:ATP-grasp ribosomal peptide maturase [Actinokineospora baliensis]|uniref:ATP-grasp ribosomal peptide maturase n=1 Tax=Actinokineospora baliensis TaxID=547056 RepID=UPI00195BB6E3|nr:ATP-grasp ribosomal peptide maturase [Actinokineospora baliensis]MBM7774207.1 ATP-grasp ribosomal peptide maturase [Actinokineospora baliensis]
MTNTPGTVVILAQEADAPVDAVVRELTQRGVEVFRADTAWFPQHLSLNAHLGDDGRWRGVLFTEHRTVDLTDIGAIWYRDPSAFAFPTTLTEVERAYAHREARLGFGGVLAALPVRWVNHPNRAADSMFKPLQLATAAACGLLVAPTLVTNTPASAAQFARHHGVDNTICKSFGPNTITEGGQLKIAYTRRLTENDLEQLDGVASTATQLQRWVNKTHEARVIVIGERMFTIAITADSPAARVDWRADFTALRYQLTDTPTEVEKGLRRYMDTLGLTYAAVDFAIEKDRFWFLESNSSGQYGWLEAQTGAPIAAALADLLAHNTRGHL